MSGLICRAKGAPSIEGSLHRVYGSRRVALRENAWSGWNKTREQHPRDLLARRFVGEPAPAEARAPIGDVVDGHRELARDRVTHLRPHVRTLRVDALERGGIVRGTREHIRQLVSVRRGEMRERASGDVASSDRRS